jgi:hypothetical protein
MVRNEKLFSERISGSKIDEGGWIDKRLETVASLEVCHPSCAVSMVWNLGGYIFTIAYIYTVLIV